MAELAPVKRALLSVSDKSGLVEFARGLDAMGVELISTGGTASVLRDAGLAVIEAREVTGFPEIMDGRVKTLHPKIHGGILAKRDVHAAAMQEHDIKAIDLVCVNLYPFEATVAKEGVTREQAIEQIDIGGPCMIRAAAKNCDWVTAVTSPKQYDEVLRAMQEHGGSTPTALRQRLSIEAFTLTARYDAAISKFLAQASGEDIEVEAQAPAAITIRARRVQDLRYGENPHQAAALYQTEPESPSIVGASQLHGKALSYNNILDADAALRMIVAMRAFDDTQAGACVMKHTNPCGAAVAPGVRDAIDLAIAGDPMAAFGGILAVNTPIDTQASERICAKDSFFEVVIAPEFEPGALERLRARWKNVRLLAVGPVTMQSQPMWEFRSVRGGLLYQQRDQHVGDPSAWNHVAGPDVQPLQIRVAVFLDLCVRALTSNAIAIGGVDGAGIRLFGAGAGQMDRVAACGLAIEKAGERCRGAVAASDAFFPFPDGPGLLVDAGISLIVHPGGSKRDRETIDLCNDRGVGCLLSGVRRFRH